MVTHKFPQEGRCHYLHTADGKCQAERWGNTPQITGDILSVPRGGDPRPQTHIHIEPLKLHARPFDNKGHSYLSVFMRNNAADVDSLWNLGDPTSLVKETPV